MITVGPIRRNIGVRTFFNMLGPIVNPAQPKYQLIGVYNLEMARIYNYLLQSIGKDFTLIHSLDGYDEIALTTDTKVITNKGEYIMTPYQLGKKKVFLIINAYNSNFNEIIYLFFLRFIHFVSYVASTIRKIK